jgi:hypothetical protein
VLGHRNFPTGKKCFVRKFGSSFVGISSAVFAFLVDSAAVVQQSSYSPEYKYWSTSSRRRAATFDDSEEVHKGHRADEASMVRTIP